MMMRTWCLWLVMSVVGCGSVAVPPDGDSDGAADGMSGVDAARGTADSGGIDGAIDASPPAPDAMPDANSCAIDSWSLGACSNITFCSIEFPGECPVCHVTQANGFANYLAGNCCNDPQTATCCESNGGMVCP